MQDPLESLANSVGGQFDIVGELGPDERGSPVYLARERETGELVALRPADRRAGDSEPVIYRSLDVGVPAGERTCPICSSHITDWRRFCGRCGTDISGVDRGEPRDPATMDLVREHIRGSRRPLEVLGEMRRAEGGAPVYFARDEVTGEIVALALERGSREASGSGEYGVQLTSLFRAAKANEPRSFETPARPAAPSGGTGEQAASGESSDEGEGALKVCPSCGAEFGAGVRFCPRDGSGLRGRAHQDELAGQVIAERYHVVRRIGQGGMGQVFLAEHVKMGRQCAIKIMSRSLTQDVDAVSRFAREASNASRINHPNIATIYDFGETRDRLLYLVMEYVEGEALARVLEREKTLPPERVVWIGRQIADALGAAHREGVVHRDLKPDNILIGHGHGGEDRVKVVDFGIAKAIRGAGDGLTRTGLVVGTPRYMSPEQLIGEAVDGRSDIYSLGCILFEMMVGEHAFAAFGGDLQITRRLTEAPPHPRERNPDVPAVLDELVVRALARDVSARFESAEALRDALDEALREPSRKWWARALDRRSAPRTGGTTAERERTGRTDPGVASMGGKTPAAPAKPPGGRISGGSAARAAPPSTGGGRNAAPFGSGDGPSGATPGRTPAFGIPEADASSRRRLVALLVLVPLLIVAAVTGIRTLIDGNGGAVDPSGVDAPPPGTGAGPQVPVVPPVSTVPPDSVATAASDSAPPAGPPEPAASPASRGRLVLLGTLPRGARLVVDGVPRSRPPDGILTLAAGAHSIRIEAPGHEPAVWRRELAAGARVEWRPRLVPIAEPDPPAREPDPPPVRAETARAEAARSFDASVTAELQRLEAELEARTIRPSMPQQLEDEWQAVFERTRGSQLRVGLRGIQTDSARGTARFLLLVADAAGQTLMQPADYEARFTPVPGGWRLIQLIRR